MNPILNWSLDAGPSGMTIDHVTGVVTWSTPVAASTPYTITIRATNSIGNGTRTWHLTVGGGDLNQDGLVTMADLPALIAVLIGSNPGPGTNPAAADVNCDGVVDGRDIQAFTKKVVGP
jgi:hypothetical protein